MSADQENPIVIACGANNAYSRPLAAMLASIDQSCANYTVLEIHILSYGISAQNKKRIAKSIKRENIQLFWRAPQIPTGMSKKAFQPHYLRLLLPYVLPQRYKKVLYLDSDVIVTTDLEELWKIPLEDAPIAAVQDPICPLVSSEIGIPNYQELGLSPDTKYFNSGVLLMNLEVWRDENIASDVFGYLERYKEHIRWFDQDALNAVLANRWLPLPPHWNHLVFPLKKPTEDEIRFFRNRNSANRYCIIHYVSEAKPWDFTYKHPARGLYFCHLDKTHWKNWRPRESMKKKIIELIKLILTRFPSLRAFPRLMGLLFIGCSKGRIDHVLELLSKTIANPLFVKVGANDGLTGDPCGRAFLENKNWRGILIEPVPYCMKKLARVYSEDRFTLVQSAVGAEEGRAPFYYVSEQALEAHPDLPPWWDQLASFSRKHIVHHLKGKLEPFIIETSINIEPLNKILNEQAVEKIEFLHVDTEGYDYEVVKTLCFEKYQPLAVLIEHKHLSDKNKFSLRKLLIANDMELHEGHSDFFACKREVSKAIRKRYGSAAFLSQILRNLIPGKLSESI